MTIVTGPSIDIGAARGTEELDVRSLLLALLADHNGNIDDTNVKVAANLSGAKLLNASIPFTKLTPKIVYGQTASAAFGGANRATFTIAHTLGVVPLWWIAFANLITGANTSTGQNEPIICSRQGENSANLTVMCAIANGATAAVGTTINWLAIG